MKTQRVNVQDLGRIREILGVLSRHGFGPQVMATGLENLLSDRVPDPRGTDLPWAVRIREAIMELGPTFVKLGQILSVRADLIPAVLVVELQKLQDQVSPVDLDAIHKMVEEELSAPLDLHFQVFEDQPLASASIAQVHRAVLQDGTVVAVKVQRPGIEPIIRSDVRILYTLARLLQGELNLAGVYTLSDIVSEFEEALYQELDFLREARNCERFRTTLAGPHPRVVIPRTFPALSTRRLLTMEMIEGEPISVLTPQDPRSEAFAHEYIDCTLTQVFDNGFFHGDPHPGNVFLMPDNRIAYLDFGLAGTLTAEMVQSLATIFTTLVFRDAEGLALAVYQAGATHGRVDLKAFSKEVSRLLEKYSGAAIKDFAERANLLEIIEAASRFHITLPREYAILARTAALTYGVAQRLIPNVDIMEESRPRAQKLIASRLDPAHMATEAARMFMHARNGFTRLPLEANQLLADLEAGRLQILTRDPDAEAMRMELRHGGTRISLALCAVGMAIAGAIMVSSLDWTVHGLPLIPFLGMLSLLTGTALWVYLVAHTHFAEMLRPKGIFHGMISIARFLSGPKRR